MTEPALVARLRRADQAALARGLTTLEQGGDRAAELMEAVRAHTRPVHGQAVVIGVTGPPGVGKSVLTGRLIGRARQAGGSVGVLAVDPSSAASGGALLADRVRMAEHFGDGQVFIRSFGSRGQQGGLAPAVADAVELMELAGRKTVLIETVGVGQDAVSLACYVDVLVLVLMPNLGDELQAAKAGIAEVADVIVVNKADLPAAAAAARQLRAMVALRAANRKRPPVLCTSAVTGEGVADLWNAIGDIAGRLLAGSGAGRAQARVTRAVDAAVGELRAGLLSRRVGPAGLLDDIGLGRSSPAALRSWLLGALGGSAGSDHADRLHRGPIGAG